MLCWSSLVVLLSCIAGFARLMHFVLQIVILALVSVAPARHASSRVGKILSLTRVVFDNLLQGVLLRKTFDIFIEIQTVIKHILEARCPTVLVVQLHCWVRNEWLVLDAFAWGDFILILVFI